MVGGRKLLERTLTYTLTQFVYFLDDASTGFRQYVSTARTRITSSSK